MQAIYSHTNIDQYICRLYCSGQSMVVRSKHQKLLLCKSLDTMFNNTA